MNTPSLTFEFEPCTPMQISRFLGSGGYGEVYLCKWASVDVAVKCLTPALLGPSSEEGMGRSVSQDAVRGFLFFSEYVTAPVVTTCFYEIYGDLNTP